jgi:hypothetical protein
MLSDNEVRPEMVELAAKLLAEGLSYRKISAALAQAGTYDGLRQAVRGECHSKERPRRPVQWGR